MVEGVEHPHPIKAMPHELLELHLDNLHRSPCLSGLLPAKGENSASAGFLM